MANSYLIRITIQKPGGPIGFQRLPKAAKGVSLRGKAVLFTIPHGPEYLGRVCGVGTVSGNTCVDITLPHDDVSHFVDYVMRNKGETITHWMPGFHDCVQDFVCGEEFNELTDSARDLGQRIALRTRKHGVDRDRFKILARKSLHQWRDIMEIGSEDRFLQWEHLVMAWWNGVDSAYEDYSDQDVANLTENIADPKE